MKALRFFVIVFAYAAAAVCAAAAIFSIGRRAWLYAIAAIVCAWCDLQVARRWYE